MEDGSGRLSTSRLQAASAFTCPLLSQAAAVLLSLGGGGRWVQRAGRYVPQTLAGWVGVSGLPGSPVSLVIVITGQYRINNVINSDVASYSRPLRINISNYSSASQMVGYEVLMSNVTVTLHLYIPDFI